MEINKIKIQTIEPTGIVIDEKEFNLTGIDDYPTRMLLEINDNVWMITKNGKEIRKIVPKK